MTLNILRRLEDWPAELQGGAVTIGNYDGVHRGHAQILQRVVAMSEQLPGPATVLSFDPHPMQVLNPDRSPPALTTLERRAELLGQLGIEAILFLATDAKLLSLSAEAFFQKVVCDRIRARALVEGEDFEFGSDRAGDAARLQTLCAPHQMQVEIVAPLVWDEQVVSSSRIRELIQSGQVDQAAQLLARPYRVSGKVERGAGRGCELGFPTANLTQVPTMLPARGVYAGRGWLEGRPLAASINIGPNPTFGEKRAKFEVHLIDFSSELYGRTLEVDFLARLRDTRPFRTPEELKLQLARDRQAARDVAAGCDGGP